MDPEEKVFRYLGVTHDGPHHMDDVMATAILQLRFGGGVRIVRTGNPENFPEADFVFDTGGKCDLRKGRFDHHQGHRDPSIPRARNRGRGYASAGLVWRRFGMGVCRKFFIEEGMPEVPLSRVREVYDQVDQLLMRPIDNWDNGATKGSFDVIPAQHLVSAMKFSHAVNACMKVLGSHVHRSVAAEKELLEARDTMNTGEGVQAWFFDPHLVLQARPGGSLQLHTARRIARERYDREVLAVISGMARGGSVLLLGSSVWVSERSWGALPESAKVGVDRHHGGSMFFSGGQEPLVALARALCSTVGALERKGRP